MVQHSCNVGNFYGWPDNDFIGYLVCDMITCLHAMWFNGIASVWVYSQLQNLMVDFVDSLSYSVRMQAGTYIPIAFSYAIATPHQSLS